LLLFGIFIFYSLFNISAQRIEVHGIKDLSTHSIANKAWGVGGAVDLDQCVKNTVFRINFNWAMYKKNDEIKHNHQRFSGGVSAFYSVKVQEKISLQCGAEVNFTGLKHSYRYDTEEVDPTSATGATKYITLLQNGNFIGIGPHIGARYAFGPRVSMVFNFVPTYLIPVSSKSSLRNVDTEYDKGIWMFPLQLGFSVRLFNPDSQ
jgi:hypothetical protein